MKAVIMAGGEGTRLRPLTCEIPKPMVPVANRPVMEHIVGLAVKHGIEDIAVTLQYLPGVIKRYFGDGSDFGASLEYFTESKPLGTAGSVKNTESFIKETFIVISGDALTDIDISAACRFHVSQKALVTLVLKRVEIPLEYGVVITDEHGRIKRFMEKPGWGEVFSDTVNTGIYIMSPEIFNYIEDGKKLDFSGDIFPVLLEGNIPMYGYITEDYWCDIGDMDAYTGVHRDILDGKVDIDIKGRNIGNGIWVGKNCSISKDAVLEAPCIVGDNNCIRENARIGKYSVMGNSNFIGRGVVIENTIIWDRCVVERNSLISGGNICNKVYIEEGVSLFEGGTVGENCVIGGDSTVGHGVKIWPGKRIEPCTGVTCNKVAGKRATDNIFGNYGVKGGVGTGITPEYAARLGAAFISSLGDNYRIVVGNDGTAVSIMTGNSLISGMACSGAEVTLVGETSQAVVRSAVGFFNCAGGIYIEDVKDDNESIRIDFIGKNGVSIDRATERKIERFLSRDDYRRVGPEEIKNVREFRDYGSFHYNLLGNNMKPCTIHNRIFITSRNRKINAIIGGILGQKGYEVEILTEGSADKHDFLNDVADRVVSNGFDIGAMLLFNPDGIILIDNRGRILSGETLTALVSLMFFEKNRGGSFVAPVASSSVLEKISAKYDGRIIRTKNSRRDLMDMLVNGNDTISFEQKLFYFDPPAYLFETLDFLQERACRLNTFVDLIPDIHMSKKQVDCSWSRKGRVIRSIIQNHKEGEIETIEGVKIHKNGGWVLILPDAEKPVCNIIGEGVSEEYAEELTGFYANEIKELADTNGCD